jgi:hypothetical protein
VLLGPILLSVMALSFSFFGGGGNERKASIELFAVIKNIK